MQIQPRKKAAAVLKQGVSQSLINICYSVVSDITDPTHQDHRFSHLVLHKRQNKKNQNQNMVCGLDFPQPALYKEV